MSWHNIALVFLIACFAIGTIWIVASAVGSLLAPQYWLLFIGVVGLFCIYIFGKYRE